MKKVFLLGIGAQRSGTTWLHRYLHLHPSVNLGFAKEYHIFDALYIPEEGIRRLFLQDRIKKFIADPQPSDTDLTILRFLGDTDTYFDYFNDLVIANPGTRVTGDLTPSYAGLPVEIFRRIRTSLLKRDFEVRVVFLLRDPVERCISAARHSLSRATAPPTQNVERRVLRDSYRSVGCRMRTRYDLTIRNLEQAFDPSELIFFFYEDLFTPASIGKLNASLGLDHVEPNLNDRINETSSEHAVDESLRHEIFSYYEVVYEFAAERFGADYVRSIWRSYAKFKGEPSR